MAHSEITFNTNNASFEAGTIEARLALLSRGWPVMPCKGKVPRFKGWPKVEITADWLRAITDERPDMTNECFRTGEIVGVDYDITDVALLQNVETAVEAAMGGTSLKRKGSKGHLSVYYNMEPISKRTVLGVRRNEEGEVIDRQLVEFLGTGNHFAAFGSHPKTGKLFEWMGKATPFNTHAEDVTETNPAKIAEAITAIENVMIAAGYEVKQQSAEVASAARKASGMPFWLWQVESMLRLVDPEDLSRLGSNSWSSIAAAIKFARVWHPDGTELTEDELRELFADYSRGAYRRGAEVPSNYGGEEDTYRMFDDMDPPSAAGHASSASLVKMAMDAGWTGEPGVGLMDWAVAVDTSFLKDAQPLEEVSKSGGDIAEIEALLEALSIELKQANAVGKYQSLDATSYSVKALLLSGEPVPIEWAVEGWIEKGKPFLLQGDSNSAKSWLLAQLGVCCMAGRAFLEPNRKINAASFVYVGHEDDYRAFGVRVRDIAKGLFGGEEFNADDLEDTFYFIDRTGLDTKLIRYDGRTGDFTLLPGLVLLIKKLTAIKGHKIVILDSGYDFVEWQQMAAVNRDSVNHYLKVFLPWLSTLTDSTFGQIEHPSQAGVDRGDMSGNSAAWRYAVRTRFGIERRRKPKAKGKGANSVIPGKYDLHLFKISNGKGEDGRVIPLMFQNGALVIEGPSRHRPEKDKLREAVFRYAVDACRKGEPLRPKGARGAQGQVNRAVIAELASLKLVGSTDAEPVTLAGKPLKVQVEELIRSRCDGLLVAVKGSRNGKAGLYPASCASAWSRCLREGKPLEPDLTEADIALTVQSQLANVLAEDADDIGEDADEEFGEAA